MASVIGDGGDGGGSELCQRLIWQELFCSVLAYVKEMTTIEYDVNLAGAIALLSHSFCYILSRSVENNTGAVVNANTSNPQLTARLTKCNETFVVPSSSLSSTACCASERVFKESCIKLLGPCFKTTAGRSEGLVEKVLSHLPMWVSESKECVRVCKDPEFAVKTTGDPNCLMHNPFVIGIQLI